MVYCFRQLKYGVFLCLVVVILVSFLKSEAVASPRGGSKGSGSKGSGSKGSGSKGSGSKGSTRLGRGKTTWSAKGGTRSVFSRAGAFGKGGKNFPSFQRSSWRNALLLGLAVSIVTRGRGPRGEIVYYGSDEYIISQRGIHGIPPTVCYNDVIKGVNGSILYHFLCPKNDTTKDEEYCCDKNDNINQQYCCDKDEWNSAPTFISTMGTIVFTICFARILS